MYLEYEVYFIFSILGLFWLKTNNIKIYLSNAFSAIQYA